MRRILSISALCLSLLVTGHAQAWWGTPYGGYWPNAWPGQGVQPGYYNNGIHRWNYGGPDWQMRGYMTEWGDMNVVIEYRGNMNNAFGGYPGYGPYPQPFNPYYGWR